jgi:hypothetical protein
MWAKVRRIALQGRGFKSAIGNAGLIGIVLAVGERNACHLLVEAAQHVGHTASCEVIGGKGLAGTRHGLFGRDQHRFEPGCMSRTCRQTEE